jgi:hypothetical protein
MIDISGATCYLSGPMTGLHEMNRPFFNHVANLITASFEVKEVINPAKQDSSLSWQETMEVDLNDIRTRASCLILLPGWNLSKGAKIEVQLAISLGLPLITYEELLSAILG